jgi:peptidoglycan/xylan/chitin deacetylase (PgdA/CDA1 family)
MRVYTLHSVADNGISLAPRQFRRFMKFVGRKFGFADPSRLESEASSGRALITFDDCYADNLSNAVPILREFGAKAIFFFSPGFMGQVTWGSPKHGRWSDRRDADYHVPFSFLGIPELHVLRDLGHEIGFHSRTHRNLTDCDDAVIRDEIVAAKGEWESRVGFPFRCFAYPRGKFDERMPALLGEAGFQFGFTTKPGDILPTALEQDPYLLPRYPVMRKGIFGWL